jgi:hypothetical protein
MADSQEERRSQHREKKMSKEGHWTAKGRRRSITRLAADDRLAGVEDLLRELALGLLGWLGANDGALEVLGLSRASQGMDTTHHLLKPHTNRKAEEKKKEKKKWKKNKNKWKKNKKWKKWNKKNKNKNKNKIKKKKNKKKNKNKNKNKINKKNKKNKKKGGGRRHD